MSHRQINIAHPEALSGWTASAIGVPTIGRGANTPGHHTSGLNSGCGARRAKLPTHCSQARDQRVEFVLAEP